MAYTKVFTNPHPNGWDNPSERPPITADVLQAHTDAIQAIDNYLAAGGGAGGGGGGDYILPVATKTILGGVKVDGDTIAVTSDGTISVTASGGAIKNTSDLSNDGSGSGSYFVEASELAKIAFTGQYSDLKNKITKTSELENDSEFLSSIPKASTTILGGIKLDGETLTMDENGIVSVVGGGGGSSYLADLKDTEIKSLMDKQFLIYNADETKWLNQTLNIPNILTDLEDVDLPSEMIQNGDVLTYNSESSTWVNQAIDLGAGSRELTLAEYDALTAEEKNNDTIYFITDADNTNPGSVGTAGTLKPWLYDSDEEVVIGVYDGKPLYRRILVYENYALDVGRNELPFEIDNIDIIVNSNGYITNSIHTSIRPINTHVHDSTGDSLYYVIYFTDKYIHLQSNDTLPTPNIYFTLEYTKTTDAENSGTNLMPYTYVQNVGARYNYSTEEQVVGTWIDGRPIYQKTITDYDILNTTDGTVLIAENLEFLVAQPEGVAEGLSVYGTLNHEVLPKLSIDLTYILAIREQDGYIYVEKDSSFSNGTYTYFKASITFRYTKTTD